MQMARIRIPKVGETLAAGGICGTPAMAMYALRGLSGLVIESKEWQDADHKGRRLANTVLVVGRNGQTLCLDGDLAICVVNIVTRYQPASLIADLPDGGSKRHFSLNIATDLKNPEGDIQSRPEGD